jgi:hypothetical protein
MNEDELRIAIMRGRRITRDQGLLAVLDEFERRLNAAPSDNIPSLRFRGGYVQNISREAKIKKAKYMRGYMRRYRARKKAEEQA